MLIIRFIMVHMGPQHTQCGRKPARIAPVLQMGLSAHKRPLTTRHFDGIYLLKISLLGVWSVGITNFLFGTARNRIFGSGKSS